MIYNTWNSHFTVVGVKLLIRYSPCVDETISRDTLDCRREREVSRPFDPLLRRMEAKKSSLVAPAG